MRHFASLCVGILSLTLLGQTPAVATGHRGGGSFVDTTPLRPGPWSALEKERKKLRSLEAKHYEVLNEKKHLDAKIYDLKCRLDRLERDLGKLYDKKNRAHAEWDAKQAKFVHLESTWHGLKKDIELCRRRLVALKRARCNCGSHGRVRHVGRGGYGGHRQNCAVFRSRRLIREEEKKLRYLLHECDVIQSKLAKASKKARRAEKRFANLKAKVYDVECDRDRVRRDKVGVKRRLAHCEKVLAGVERTMDATRRRIEHLESRGGRGRRDRVGRRVGRVIDRTLRTGLPRR